MSSYDNNVNGRGKSYPNRKKNELGEFGRLLQPLMMRDGYKTPQSLAEKLIVDNLVTYHRKPRNDIRSYNTYKYTDEYYGRQLLDTVTKTIQRHLNESEYFQITCDYVQAYCTVFNCSADYFINGLKTTTHEATDIFEALEITEDMANKIKRYALPEKCFIESMATYKDEDLFIKLIKAIFEYSYDDTENTLPSDIELPLLPAMPKIDVEALRLYKVNTIFSTIITICRNFCAKNREYIRKNSYHLEAHAITEIK